jgi:hypothetical protein
VTEDNFWIRHNRLRAQAIERGAPVDEVTGMLLDEREPAEILAAAADFMGDFRDIASAMLEHSEGGSNLRGVLDTVLNRADKLEASSYLDSELPDLLFFGFNKVIEAWSDQAERYRNQG